MFDSDGSTIRPVRHVRLSVYLSIYLSLRLSVCLTSTTAGQGFDARDVQQVCASVHAIQHQAHARCEEHKLTADWFYWQSELASLGSLLLLRSFRGLFRKFFFCLLFR
jgi:hypothetical protein